MRRAKGEIWHAALLLGAVLVVTGPASAVAADDRARLDEAAHGEAHASIPWEALRHFLREHRIVDDPESLASLAYVIAGDDRRLISGVGDRLYVRGTLVGDEPLGVYRMGTSFVDPASGEPLGTELENVGQARRERSEGEISVLAVTSARQEVRSNDIVLPLEPRELTSGYQLRAPQRAVDGTILAVPEGVRFIGQLQVVALDRGRRDGLEPGHLLTVEQRGELVSDPRTGESLRLPGRDAGQVMVFQPFDRMSYGLVLKASRSLAVGDRVHAAAVGGP